MHAYASTSGVSSAAASTDDESDVRHDRLAAVVIRGRELFRTWHAIDVESSTEANVGDGDTQAVPEEFVTPVKQRAGADDVPTTVEDSVAATELDSLSSPVCNLDELLGSASTACKARPAPKPKIRLGGVKRKRTW